MESPLPADEKVPATIVIRGVTKDGRLFRPGDWAQRLALTASAGTCPIERPLCFHPHVRTGIERGVPYVEVDRMLERVDPELFAFLMAFASHHELERGE